MKKDYDMVIAALCILLEFVNSFTADFSGMGAIIFLLWLIYSRDLNLNQTRRK